MGQGPQITIVRIGHVDEVAGSSQGIVTHQVDVVDYSDNISG
jgi:hypothetical protein